MIDRDLHIHTTFCDGKNSAEEMVLAAIDRGLKTIGFSSHSYLPFDNACMKEGVVEDYIREIRRLKVKYQDRIEILLGIEKDYYSKLDTSVFDYVIGSVHFIRMGDDHICVDYNLPRLKEMVEKHFAGDYLAYAEKYYELAGDLKDIDIVGHFDLVTKFNEQEMLIDTNDCRYINAYQKAAAKLISRGVIFEINTGAISRGYRTSPYPAREIIDYIKEKGGRLMLNSDAHQKENIAYLFDKYEKLLSR